MALTSLPAKTAGDLGAVLTNRRTPAANELSATNLEKIKDRVIEIGTDLGIDTTPAGGSVKARLDAIEAWTATDIPITPTDHVAAADVQAALETISKGGANVSNANTSITATEAMHGTVRCTAGTTVTVTLPASLDVGTSIEFIQMGTGQVRCAAGGGATLRVAATFNPYTNEQYSSLVASVIDANTWLVRGDLDPV